MVVAMEWQRSWCPDGSDEPPSASRCLQPEPESRSRLSARCCAGAGAVAKLVGGVVLVPSLWWCCAGAKPVGGATL